MGLDITLCAGLGCKTRSLQSSLYPDHLWTPTYLASTYHELGFNYLVSTLVGKDLWDVFGATKHDIYMIQPNWEESLKVALEIQQALQRVAEETPYYAIPVKTAIREMSGPTDATQALQLFLEQWAGAGLPPDDTTGPAGGCPVGKFVFCTPLKVSAVIPGVCSDTPCVYVVYHTKLEWYLQACEILIKEFLPLGIQHRETARILWDS